MSGDNPVGIILTVKWPYQEPEIIFHHPPSSFSISTEKSVSPIKECFGLECSKLAPLILPSDSQLWNKMSDLVVESKEFQHRFIFFPSSTIKNKCVNKVSNNNTLKKMEFHIENFKLNKFIESFSITLVFIASAFINYESIQKILFKMVNSFLSCEVANNFISREILKCNENSFDYIRNLCKSVRNNMDEELSGHDKMNVTGLERNSSQEQISSIIETKNGLARKLIKYFSNIRIDDKDIATMSTKSHSPNKLINSCIENLEDDSYDQLTIFLDKEKLSRIYNENELINEIFKVADPHLSIRDISIELLEQPSNILNICQKLISKGIAKVANIISYDKVYTLYPEMIEMQMNKFNLEFKDTFDWRGCNPLILISSFFCNGKKLKYVRKELVEFFQVFSSRKKMIKHLIYYPYEPPNGIHSSSIDETFKTVKSIISWLFINNCIVDNCTTSAPILYK